MNKDTNPLKIALWGALVGASAMAAVLSLRDEKNRKKLGAFIENVMQMLGQKVEDVEETLSDAGEKIEEKAKTAIKSLKERRNEKRGVN